MSLALIVVGAALVSVALFNRLPRIAARRRPERHRVTAGSASALRVRAVPARLTESGRATLTAVGGSMLIAAVLLALSGL
ncbi:hypothetical protein [Marinitenerispora sediminis]|uniref:Uncharacterized protein n=1 Tax=Marinitenerispora sediminis TaxID=1931232 RepID=A0A368T762_9ACTN|nr:hypothetical protein [Marinitenerispora sediminis]RCV52297.1 hypothetical protein DEF28_13300 [Marinitenerispora sediminis]RCV58837.1 hypothetical protein DEF23_08175 [Marinitenerispora sediminis]RCV59355.1 hypothetical protein DEF24_09775 [Marinitenerispora sediminis]